MALAPEAEMMGGPPNSKEILLDMSKKELLNPQTTGKKLHRKLKQEYKVSTNKDNINLERLQTAHLVIFGGPRDMFTSDEFTAIKEYLAGGGSIFILLGEGGEGKNNTNVNYLLEEFGISVNSDAVVRTVYHKYHHPKESLITHGVLCRDIVRAAKGEKKKDKENKETLSLNITKDDVDVASLAKDNGGLEFVFPYGATLNVQKPALPILSSGPISYPLNRPIAAVYHKAGAGRICVLGSVRMMDDDFFELEKNRQLIDTLIHWLLDIGDCELGFPYSEEPELSDYHHIPHTQGLAMNLRSCLQENEALPRDFTQLFDDSLFKFDTDLIPEAVKLYQQLGVKHEPLTLIPPQFETPMPALQPAVFPPCLREPPAPALDLFDLDEQFASERVRLAQLTNKCTDEDLDFYIRQAGEILGVTHKLGERRSAKHILEYIFKELVGYKKMNQDVAPGGLQE
jgi:intraflagellar transport protein 52|mmetsp:Transcript_395/g.581  ORF Transcript_395/g.581 Transcript_395/m.581 type:complete len:456 (-) Transcript_395:110-1477(-)